MAGSVAVAVRSAVATGLAAALDDDTAFNGVDAGKVEVTYAYDHSSSKAERVFTNRARAETPSAGLRAGRNFRNEAGEFDLVVLVALVGKSAEEVDERAFAIGEVVEEWLADRKNNELAVDGLQTLTVAGWDSTNLGADRGHITELTYRVRWTARLT